MKDQLLQVGKIGRAHSRYGEVRVRLYNDAYELLDPNTDFYLNGDRNDVIHIESARYADKFYLVRFEGCRFRDEAQNLTNLTLWVDRSAMPPTEEDEYYCADLIGFQVVAEVTQPTDCYDDLDHNDTSNDLIDVGHVTGFLDQVETDVMIVEGPKIKNRWLVPFISSVVLHVDLAQQTILLAPLELWTHEDQVFVETFDE